MDKRRRDRIPYQWLDIEQDAEAVALVEATARATEEDTVPLPIVLFPDGTQLIDPDNRTLAEKVGLRTQATQPFFDLIIVGPKASTDAYRRACPPSSVQSSRSLPWPPKSTTQPSGSRALSEH
ncbi:MAG: hypothetical protein R6W76_19810 [Caldilinea sp.]